MSATASGPKWVPELTFGSRDGPKRTAGLAQLAADVLFLMAVSPSLRQFAFLCALLPQFLLAVLAPAFSVCLETDGTRILELGVSDCCVAEAMERGASDRVGDQDDCDGCEDSALAVSHKCDERPAPLVLSLDLLTTDPTRRWDSTVRPLGVPAPSLTPSGYLRALRTVHLRC